MRKKIIYALFIFTIIHKANAQITIDSLFTQATFQLKNGNLEDGLTLLDSILTIDNYHVLALSSRAYLNAASNQNFEQVLDDLLQYSTITKSPSNFVEIGYLYLDHSHNDNAYQLADFAINKGFFNQNTYIIRGSTFFHLDKYKEAKNDFLKALEINSNERYAINLLIQAHMKLGEEEEALSRATQLISLSPDDDLTYGIRAGIHARMGNIEKALTDNSTSMSLVKEIKGRAYFSEKRAYIYQEGNNQDEACRWAMIAMRLGNNTPYFTLSYPCDTILQYDLATSNSLLFRLSNPLSNFDFLSMKETLLGLGLVLGESNENEITFLTNKEQFSKLPTSIDSVTLQNLIAKKPTLIGVFNGEYYFIPASDKELFISSKGEKADLFYIQCTLAQTKDSSKSIWIDKRGVILKYVDQGYTLFELLKVD